MTPLTGVSGAPLTPIIDRGDTPGDRVEGAVSMKIKEAVKLTGKSRTAILKALKDGKISGEKDVNGAWDIQPVDLLKYYSIDPAKLDQEVSGVTPLTPVSGAPLTPKADTPDTPEIKVLEAKLEAAQQLIEDRGQTIEHLRGELDEEKRERREAQTKLTALLSDMRPEVSQKPVERPRTRAGFWVALALVVAVLVAVGAFLWVSMNGVI